MISTLAYLIYQVGHTSTLDIMLKHTCLHMLANSLLFNTPSLFLSTDKKYFRHCLITSAFSDSVRDDMVEEKLDASAQELVFVHL